jgi:hypothetical protein
MVGKVVDALGISFPSANNALALLQRRGILVQAGTRRQRKRTLVAQEVVELLNHPPEQYFCLLIPIKNLHAKSSLDD